jgi:hypothetical protein
MKALKTIKNIPLLKQSKSPRPAIRNQTRWSSTFTMLKKFLQILPALSVNNNYPEDVLQLIPTAVEVRAITALVGQLETINIVSVNIQSEDATSTLSKVRIVFDGTTHPISISRNTLSH